MAELALNAGGGWRGAWSLLMQPWRELNRWPPFSWLAPQPAVGLLQADGGHSLWLGNERRAATARDVDAAPFVAVELPAEAHLERQLTLPPLPAEARQEAMALDVRMNSPFAPDDLVWGARVDAAPGGKGEQAVMVLASRQSVQQTLQRHQPALQGAPGRVPEVWAFDGRGQPVVLAGFGEAARLRRAMRGRGWAWALIVLALLLATAILITPTVQLKLRAMQAAAAMVEAERQFGPALAQREALGKALAQREALREQMATRVEPLAVLDLMTQLLPDDSWLQRLQVQAGKATLVGQTPNTAALMNTLSGHPQVRDVKAPGAATRAQGGRENFTIELTLAPEALRPDGAATSQLQKSAMPASSPALAATTATPPGAASVPASAPASAPGSSAARGRP